MVLRRPAAGPVRLAAIRSPDPCPSPGGFGDFAHPVGRGAGNWILPSASAPGTPSRTVVMNGCIDLEQHPPGRGRPASRMCLTGFWDIVTSAATRRWAIAPRKRSIAHRRASIRSACRRRQSRRASRPARTPERSDQVAGTFGLCQRGPGGQPLGLNTSTNKCGCMFILARYSSEGWRETQNAFTH